MAKILAAGKIPQLGLDLLKDHELEVYEGEGVISEEELCRRMAGKDALLSPLSTPVTKKVIESADQLKIIANFGAGFNNVDLEAAKEKKILVTNTPGVSTEATAELTLGIMLAISRRIPEGDQLCRTKGFDGWAPLFFLGRGLDGKKLGIVGLGSIGQAAARRAKAFGMDIVYAGPHRKEADLEKEMGASYLSLEELLEQSDYVTLHVPYNPSTHHLISAAELKRMKKSAYLINASRGAVVNENDLVHALRNGSIAGAALDVFEHEPEITEELKSMENVVLTPHIGNATVEARDAMAQLTAKNIISVLNGDAPVTPVY